VQVSGVAEVISNWEEIKAAEKGRTSAIDGVALSQPSLRLISKLLHRAEKYGVSLDLPTAQVNDAEMAVEQILAIAAWASANEIDLDSLLRQRARALMAQIQSNEAR
jgi:XTP/dITP diphosphohydrolase